MCTVQKDTAVHVPICLLQYTVFVSIHSTRSYLFIAVYNVRFHTLYKKIQYSTGYHTNLPVLVKTQSLIGYLHLFCIHRLGECLTQLIMFIHNSTSRWVETDIPTEARPSSSTWCMMVKPLNDSQGQGRPCPWPDNFWFVFVCLFVFKVGVNPEILKKKKNRERGNV